MSIHITPEQLTHINQQLAQLTPQEIIRWSYITFPQLYQITAFGLTGLVTIDMISKMNLEVDLVFIDTLFHFPQTLELVDKVEQKYGKSVTVFKPNGFDTEKQFTDVHGSLWETDDLKYDFLVKVEPLQRAYKQLNINAVLTGRRGSQGGDRSNLPFVEIDHEFNIIKINPFLTWKFDQVQQYVTENSVPYNELLNLGYKSVGDWHSTEPVADGEDERSGRWKGKAKTECGIHSTSKYALYLKNQALGEQQKAA
ncbi:3'-phosphoadenylsulfate reductase [Yamadazyma tenuis]|uniref:Phosphoadenosine phosphosulphate reductase domain-containing protein n=1 Tax=Candida tenuis (strain ATCC 10573 / BCRC 21748 / CBS 615 / JCM 9827 / NBRC 10315 / NRRL Y-1498 / VKM Y-70) TaxID=590646 RepID=G3B6J4_CANTC|nr:uncharacterized protein CANTEDRAFT_106520 [Yamadazyma tenuis ATCC 10573]EGV63486.1 hypothetical protein CANTEDRAFT_106520 [Yamadazyma tenuis ATCC 10573]WEJ96692.1 3'-phosphoadenylsulfate reductase [Yamadazyma tenuis]